MQDKIQMEWTKALKILRENGSMHTAAAAANVRKAELQNPKPPDHSEYRPDIDGLRAVAVLAVVGFHAAPGRIPAGFIGVDIFFVISGFLISTIIMKGLDTGTFTYADFYSRRIKRIFPALLLVLVANLAVGYLVMLDEQIQELSKHVAGGAGFVSNLVLWGESGYFDNAADFKPLLHLWSLGIEEQFYIVWPLILCLAWKKKFNSLTVIVTVLSLSLALNIVQINKDPVGTFYSPLTRFWELLIGAGLASVCLSTTNRSAIERKPFSNFVGVSGVVLIAVAFAFIDKEQPFPGWWALLPTFGTAFVIWAGPNAWFNRAVLSNRVLVWFGLISFPLYLWHWPMLSALRILEGTEVVQWKRGVAVVVAIALAGMTYRFVERPVRQGSRNMGAQFLLAGLMCFVGLVGCYGYFSNGFEGRTEAPRVVNEGEIGHFDFFSHISKRYYPCTPSDIYSAAGDWNGFVRCFQSKSGSIRDVAIIGDSHAEHLFPGLAARLPESNVVFYGKGALPFLSSGEFDRIFESVLGDKNISVVLLTARWSTKIKEYPIDKWTYELAETIAKLTGAGKQVYITDDIPVFNFMPYICKYDRRLWVKNRCDEADHHTNAAYLPVLEAIAATTGGGRVGVIKTYDLFCHQAFCSMARDGVLFFRDDHHLNVFGSTVVANAIAENIFRQKSAAIQPRNRSPKQ